MKRNRYCSMLLMLLFAVQMQAQHEGLISLDFLIGKWSGEGTGFGNDRSTVQAEYKYIMNGAYIEVSHASQFEPTDSNSEGEKHLDRGFISFDDARGILVYRQFNNEGYINQYILDEAGSGDTILVFVTESIEGFVPGGKARYTIIKHSDEALETIFDVSLPGRDYACFGTNRFKRIQ